MNINVSIETRMTSSRLPGKVLKLINNKPTLEILVNRVKQSKLIDNIIVATTENSEDDQIVSWCEENGIDYFRGSENNVYDRVLKTHIKYNTDVIVELTGDNPLVDPSIIDETINTYLKNDYDYISLGKGYPTGMEIQIYSLKTLKSVSNDRELQYEDKEHVTPYMYSSGKYTVYHKEAPENLTMPQLSVTLDTIEDWEVINNICKGFDNFDFSLKEIINFAKTNQNLVNKNYSIQRKGLS